MPNFFQEAKEHVQNVVDKVAIPAEIAMVGITVEMCKGAVALYELVDRMPAGELIKSAATAVSNLPDHDKQLLVVGTVAAVTAAAAGAKMFVDSPAFPKIWREEIHARFPILGYSPEQKAVVRGIGETTEKFVAEKEAGQQGDILKRMDQY